MWPHIEWLQLLHIELYTDQPITHTDVDADGEGGDDAQAPRKF